MADQVVRLRTQAGGFIDVLYHDNGDGTWSQTGVTQGVAGGVAVATVPTAPALTAVSVVIADGASLSGAGVLVGTPVALILDAALDTQTLTFQGSSDGANYQNMYDAAGSELSAAGVASRRIVLNPVDFVNCTHLKVRSGLSGAPANQGGATTVTIVCRAV